MTVPLFEKYCLMLAYAEQHVEKLSTHRYGSNLPKIAANAWKTNGGIAHMGASEAKTRAENVHTWLNHRASMHGRGRPQPDSRVKRSYGPDMAMSLNDHNQNYGKRRFAFLRCEWPFKEVDAKSHSDFLVGKRLATFSDFSTHWIV